MTASAEPARYIGRFAPSPTGPLHFGSLLAAVASYLQARSSGGQWLLRIEDIDPPREQPGATEAILVALERYGFAWDGPVHYQSHNRPRHDLLIRQLLDSGRGYPCSCSRRDLAGARRGSMGAIYPGTCRNGCTDTEVAIRVRTDDLPVAFVDRLQGPQSQQLERESGDFIVKRRDGLIAYHLAVVADDADQGITEVVRGVDLLQATPSQIHLQRLLGLPSPDYMHIPVIETADGQKLSKRTGATPVPDRQHGQILVAALRALGQQPPAELAQASLDDIWDWATANWEAGILAGKRQISATQDPLAQAQNGLW